MELTQDRAPILEGLEEFQKANATSFGVPGHKSGKGAPSDVVALLGKYAFRADATTQKGIDDRRMSKHVRQDAERLAAKAWGAEHCFFSTNGSSLSNHVAMLTVASPGDTVLVARNSHKSLIAATIIGHVRPAFLQPDYDPTWDIEHGIAAAELERQLAAHPEAKAVFVVSPTYYGVTSDIERLAGICHARNVPLVVDEAWAPHFPFHPEMPTSAIHAGADLSITSIHKTMSGLEQASIMLLNSRLIAADRFSLCFDMFETTSPSVPILASIDASRRQFVQEGRELLDGVLKNARWTRQKLAALPGVRAMGREVLDGDSRCALDETKVFFDVTGLGVNGYAAEDWLQSEQKVSMGESDSRNLLAVFTAGNTGRSATTLVKSVKALAAWAEQHRDDPSVAHRVMPRLSELRTEMVMPPWEAFFARAEHVPLERAVGRVAAEMVSPYPPGVPRVLPGERITARQVEYLQAGLRAGFFAMDPSDMRLRTLRVVG